MKLTEKGENDTKKGKSANKEALVKMEMVTGHGENWPSQPDFPVAIVPFYIIL